MKVKIKLAKGIIRQYMILLGVISGRRRTKAWTSFWKTIYFMHKKDMKNKKIIKHELKHIEQFEREGKFIFSIKYMYYALTKGYWNNPYEIEARKAM